MKRTKENQHIFTGRKQSQKTAQISTFFHETEGWLRGQPRESRELSQGPRRIIPKPWKWMQELPVYACLAFITAVVDISPIHFPLLKGGCLISCVSSYLMLRDNIHCLLGVLGADNLCLQICQSIDGELYVTVYTRHLICTWPNLDDEFCTCWYPNGMRLLGNVGGADAFCIQEGGESLRVRGWTVVGGL